MMVAKETTSNTLEKVVAHDLIRGEFKADDTAEIINHMLMTKINFHERRNFSSQIRFGENDHASLERVKELQQAKIELGELIELAKASDRSLKISSTISIELI